MCIIVKDFSQLFVSHIGEIIILKPQTKPNSPDCQKELEMVTQTKE